jgi:sterol desaturase/sphingolipid hydroxylase (fatty acid hydroxylase superfamily)
MNLFVFPAIILVSMEIIAAVTGSQLLAYTFGWTSISVKGKHLETLESLDVIYIILNKLLTVPFAYHLIEYCFKSSHIVKNLNEITVWNTVIAFPLCFTIYEFFYFTMHRIIHHRSVYAYIHKHHHRTKAPTRGNIDGLNAHPIEYILASYFHLLTIYTNRT